MNLVRLPPPLLMIAFCLPLVTAGCGIPIGVTAASTAADGASLATTNKTTLDHFTSMVSRKDCSMTRMVGNNKVCRDREDGHDPYAVSYNDAFRTVGEGGVEYSAPLEPAANAPATSWDAAAYKAPAEPPAVQAKAPAAATPAVPARKKQPAAARPAKKPAQGQVASRP